MLIWCSKLKTGVLFNILQLWYVLAFFDEQKVQRTAFIWIDLKKKIN